MALENLGRWDDERVEKVLETYVGRPDEPALKLR